MPQASLSPVPRQQFSDTAGVPLPGAKVYFYATGTSTPITAWTDAAMSAAHPNPAICDAGGFLTYYLAATSYKIAVYSTTNVLQYTVDPVAAVPDTRVDLVVDGTAGEDLLAGDVVYLSAGTGGGTAGRWYKADADQEYSSTTAQALGMMTAAALTGAVGSVRLVGRSTDLSGLTPGTLYYVSATAGQLTATAPTFARPVAVADTSTSAILSQWTASATSVGSLRQTFRGLHLRTSPDLGDVTIKVQLMRADEIVMDDGTRVENWDDLVASSVASGAGGLDTGSRVVSTWYEVWAIRKSSDGTKNLLLHRAKDYFLDETFLTGEDTSHILRRATAPVNTKLAQGLKVDTTGLMEVADVALIRVGAVASSQVWLTVEADAAGLPSGTPLATSDKMDASKIATSSQLLKFVFRTPATLTAATQYHLVLQGDYAASDTVYIAWRADGTAAGYANGSKAFYNDAVWASDTDDDMMFRVYVTRNDAAVTMPTGYDQKCKVGYVYNNSANALVQFTAFDRQVSPLVNQALGNVTATIRTLTDLSAFIPPGPVALSLYMNNTTAAASTYVAPVPDGFNDANVRGGGAARLTQPVTVGDVLLEVLPILTEFQGCYSSTTAGTMISGISLWRW